MWVAQFRIDASSSLLGRAAKDAGVKALGYPVSFYEKPDAIYVYVIAFLFGEDKNKKAFVDKLKNDANVINVEKNNDFLIFQIIQPTESSVIFNHKILYVKPVELYPDGTENWSIASWDKEELIYAAKFMTERFNGTLLKINEVGITNFSMLSINPQLSAKQRSALSSAIQHGYYNHPRKISIKELAELSNLSFSTFQAHLRKAENKMVPFVFDKLI